MSADMIRIHTWSSNADNAGVRHRHQCLSAGDQSHGRGDDAGASRRQRHTLDDGGGSLYSRGLSQWHRPAGQLDLLGGDGSAHGRRWSHDDPRLIRRRRRCNRSRGDCW